MAHPQRSDSNILLRCLDHPEPCLPGCCVQTTLTQVMYQWMAANDYANFRQIPPEALEGLEDLPDAILKEPIYTYFVTEDQPFEGATQALRIAIRSQHSLSSLTIFIILKGSICTIKPRGTTQQEAVKRHKQFLRLAADTSRALLIKRQHMKNSPSNQETLAEERKFILGVQRQSLDEIYKSTTGQTVVEENQQWVSWRESSLKCLLCHTMWYDKTPLTDRRPTQKTTGAFTSSTIKFLEHFFNHIEHDEVIRCEAFLRFLDDVPQFREFILFNFTKRSIANST